MRFSNGEGKNQDSSRVDVFKVLVACKIEYIDFEGRSDGRSIKKILSHVQPRKLVNFRLLEETDVLGVGSWRTRSHKPSGQLLC